MKKIVLIVLFLLLPAFSAKADDTIQVKAAMLLTSPVETNAPIPETYLKHLKKLFPGQAYEQAGESILTLAKAQRVKQVLPGDYELVLTLQGMEGNKARVQTLIRKDAQTYVDTVLAIENKGIVILGGPPTGEKLLIIVLETGF